MVIIHPFHRISEDARHCSALSYLQVADRESRVPEVIDRHCMICTFIGVYDVRTRHQTSIGGTVPNERYQVDHQVL